MPVPPLRFISVQKVREEPVSKQLRYLEDQKRRAEAAGRFESIPLLDKALAEERDRINREVIAPLVQEGNTTRQQLRDAEYAEARRGRDEGANVKRLTEDDEIGDDATVTAQITAAFKQFRKWLDDSGIKVSMDAHKAFAAWLQKNVSFDLRSLSTWRSAFWRAVEIGLFPEGEVVFPEPQDESAPETESTPDPRTVTGRNAERRAHYQGILGEAKPVFDQFLDFVEKEGNHYLTDSEQRQLIAWVQKSGLFPSQPQTWMKALRAVFPQYLSDAEKADLQMSKDVESMTADDFARKYGVRRRSYGDPVIASNQIDH